MTKWGYYVVAMALFQSGSSKKHNASPALYLSFRFNKVSGREFMALVTTPRSQHKSM